jgi:hypothetical protein
VPALRRLRDRRSASILSALLSPIVGPGGPCRYRSVRRLDSADDSSAAGPQFRLNGRYHCSFGTILSEDRYRQRGDRLLGTEHSVRPRLFGRKPTDQFVVIPFAPNQFDGGDGPPIQRIIHAATLPCVDAAADAVQLRPPSHPVAVSGTMSNMGLIKCPEGDELQWLAARTTGDGFTGYDTSGWADTIWVLHAMYENRDLPTDTTYDDKARAEAGLPPASSSDASGCNARLIGCPGGESRWPGPGWERLQWATLAERKSIQLFSDGVLPCFRTFRFGSWPLSIRPPAEGSLDWEQLVAVVEHLCSISDAGMATACYAYYSNLVARDWEAGGTYRGSLADILGAYGDGSFFGSPSNFWPASRAWMVYTDCDLWATRVSGPRGLIHSLVDDQELETVRMPGDG